MVLEGEVAEAAEEIICETCKEFDLEKVGPKMLRCFAIRGAWRGSVRVLYIGTGGLREDIYCGRESGEGREGSFIVMMKHGL